MRDWEFNINTFHILKTGKKHQIERRVPWCPVTVNSSRAAFSLLILWVAFNFNFLRIIYRTDVSMEKLYQLFPFINLFKVIMDIIIQKISDRLKYKTHPCLVLMWKNHLAFEKKWRKGFLTNIQQRSIGSINGSRYKTRK